MFDYVINIRLKDNETLTEAQVEMIGDRVKGCDGVLNEPGHIRIHGAINAALTDAVNALHLIETAGVTVLDVDIHYSPADPDRYHGMDKD